jgi:hypothetical protein
MNTTTTYTAVRNGRVYAERATLAQIEALLRTGYCIAGRDAADASGNVQLYLGLRIG